MTDYFFDDTRAWFNEDTFGYFRESRKTKRYPGFDQHPSIYPVSSGVLPYASYTDDRYKTAQVVFDDTANAAEFKSLNWSYSDRLYQWDAEKHNAAHDHAIAECGRGRTVEYAKAYISHYFPGGTLKAIATGHHPVSGNDYYIYGVAYSKE